VVVRQFACTAGDHALKDVANWGKHAEARFDRKQRFFYTVAFAHSD